MTLLSKLGLMLPEWGCHPWILSTNGNLNGPPYLLVGDISDHHSQQARDLIAIIRFGSCAVQVDMNVLVLWDVTIPVLTSAAGLLSWVVGLLWLHWCLSHSPGVIFVICYICNYSFVPALWNLVPPQNPVLHSFAHVQCPAMSSVATAQLMFLSENGYCVSTKIIIILKYSRVWKGPKAKGHVSAIRNWIICFWVIQTALIWLMAWLQIKAMWITQEWMIQFLRVRSGPWYLPSSPAKIQGIRLGSQTPWWHNSNPTDGTSAVVTIALQGSPSLTLAKFWIPVIILFIYHLCIVFLIFLEIKFIIIKWGQEPRPDVAQDATAVTSSLQHTKWQKLTYIFV